MVTIQDFQKLDIRACTILKVEDHPAADKLYVLQIDFGDEQRQIVAGIKNSYTKEELVNKQIFVIKNLEPAVIRGVESNGMLMAVEDENKKAFVLVSDKKVDNNCKVY